MAQISKGDTFTDGQQVTGARLNQLVDSSVLLVGAITDQPSITANTLEATDAIIVSDAGVLKKATIGDVVGSGLPLATSSITAQSNKDVVITPNDGVVVVGSTYVSPDAINVTVTTAVAHGLSVGQLVQIYGAGTGYNGVFKITAVTSLTFTYVLSSLYPPSASVTTTPTACTYYTKAANRIIGNSTIIGNQYSSGVVTSYLEADTQALINSSITKTANVTTAMQYSGVPVWGLVSITETTVPFAQCDATTELQRVATCNQWRDVLSITGQTKTNKELWIVEVDVPKTSFDFLGSSMFRIILNSTSSVLAMQTSYIQNYGNFLTNQLTLRAVIPEGTVFSSDAIKFQFRYNAGFAHGSGILNVGYGGSMTDPTITRVVRVTKFAKP
jgi:hypothetical protein